LDEINFWQDIMDNASEELTKKINDIILNDEDLLKGFVFCKSILSEILFRVNNELMKREGVCAPMLGISATDDRIYSGVKNIITPGPTSLQ
jgi:hypothetical protein